MTESTTGGATREHNWLNNFATDAPGAASGSAHEQLEVVSPASALSCVLMPGGTEAGMALQLAWRCTRALLPQRLRPAGQRPVP